MSLNGSTHVLLVASKFLQIDALLHLAVVADVEVCTVHIQPVVALFHVERIRYSFGDLQGVRLEVLLLLCLVHDLRWFVVDHVEHPRILLLVCVVAAFERRGSRMVTQLMDVELLNR